MASSTAATTTPIEQVISRLAGGQIDTLLPLVMRDLGAIGKDRKNPKGFKFRGIEDALNHLHPILIAHGVSIGIKAHSINSTSFQEDLAGGKKRSVNKTCLLLDVSFIAADGSSRVNTAPGQAIAYGDATDAASAMSMAFKTAVFLGLCVPVEDGALSDPDGQSHQAVTEPEKPKQTFEQVAAAATATVPTTVPTTATATAPVPVGKQPITTAQQQRIVDLVALLNAHAALEKGLQKRGVNSLRSLNQGQAGEILATLEAADKKRIIAAEVAQAESVKQQAAQAATTQSVQGPATADQIEMAKTLISQLDPGDKSVLRKFKQAMIEAEQAGKIKGNNIADLAFEQCRSLIESLRAKTIEKFFTAVMSGN